MLKLRITDEVEGDDLVFTAPKGGPMDEHNFTRVWRKVLSSVGVRYIRPYDTRHTVTTQAGKNSKDFSASGNSALV